MPGGGRTARGCHSQLRAVRIFQPRFSTRMYGSRCCQQKLRRRLVSSPGHCRSLAESFWNSFATQALEGSGREFGEQIVCRPARESRCGRGGGVLFFKTFRKTGAVTFALVTAQATGGGTRSTGLRNELQSGPVACMPRKSRGGSKF